MLGQTVLLNKQAVVCILMFKYLYKLTIEYIIIVNVTNNYSLFFLADEKNLEKLA